MNLAAAVLLASTLHAGPEIAVTEPLRNAQPYVQRVEDAAGDDDVALVVWLEGTLVRGVRVDRDGRTLDAVPLLIAYSPWEIARVARGATNWLVITTGADRVEARLVSDAGAVGPVIPLAASAGSPAAAFDGNAYLAAWWDVNAGRIQARRISASGQVLGSAVFLDDRMIFHAVFPAAGGGFIVIAQRENVVAVRLDAQAREVSRRTLMPTFEWQAPVFALDAEERVLMGWSASEVAYVKREGAEPVAIDATSVEDFVTAGAETYAIARRDEDLVLARLDGTSVRELAGLIERARAVAFGDRVLLAHSYTDVFRTMLDASLQTITPAAFLYGEPALQRFPAIARAGNTTLLAWSEGEGLGRVRIRLNGGEPFDLGEGGPVQVATDGRDFLVTWPSGVLQHYRIVSHDGTLGTEGTLGFFSAGGCATWTGDAYVIGFVNMPPHPRLESHTAWAQRITRDGQASGSVVQVSERSNVNSVACASTASTTLFAYDEIPGGIGGATLTRGGTLARFPIGAGVAPQVAAQGDGFLAAWSRSFPTPQAHWATVTEGGTVGLEHTRDANTVRVAPRSGGYLLMYGTDPLRVLPLDGHGDPTGPELPIASRALLPVFAGGTLLSMRDTDILPQPRWRVFLRELDFAARRRVTRH